MTTCIIGFILAFLTAVGIIALFFLPWYDDPQSYAEVYGIDYDGQIDCDDEDCAEHPTCHRETDGQNAADDDFDREADCYEVDCADAPPNSSDR